jgi:hypothetical protein
MITQCPTCGAPLGQRARGRHRVYCSELCRRLADTARKAEHAMAKKPRTCDECGGTLIHPAIGRARKVCTACRPPRG